MNTGILQSRATPARDDDLVIGSERLSRGGAALDGELYETCPTGTEATQIRHCLALALSRLSVLLKNRL